MSTFTYYTYTNDIRDIYIVSFFEAKNAILDGVPSSETKKVDNTITFQVNVMSKSSYTQL